MPRKCGHCRLEGHTRRTCPQLVGAGAGAGAGSGAGAGAGAQKKKKAAQKTATPEQIKGVDLSKLEWFVWDSETTGFHRRDDRIIQLGMRLIDADGKPSDRSFQTFVGTTRRINWYAQQVHHITKLMLQGKPEFAAAFDEMIKYMNEVHTDGKEAVLVAHNGVSFDLQMLAAEMERTGKQLPSWVKYELDTVRLRFRS